MTLLEVVTLGIAVGGFVLGLLSLAIQWRAHSVDQPVVTVRTFGGLALGMPAPSLHDGESYQFIEVRNGGNQPVTIEDVGFLLAENATISLGLEGKTIGLPYRLDARDAKTVGWLALPELGRLHVTRAAVQDAWARVAGGGAVRAKKRDWSFLDDWGHGGTGGIDNR